ncbi:FAD-dependent monooxygenase [Spirillospora sp. CA-294931]|uniref:FAD-dependent monooxygenase n=1 Tax=Spirillospora sp. CA-294931 TaxID=3240042 RepID=UPI003D914AE4
MANTGAVHVEVLVVGAGPAGLIMAMTLARYGVGVLLVEKRREISTLSRALVVSTRNMEILRSWGLEDAVRAGSADVEPCGWVTRTLVSGVGKEVPLGFPASEHAARLSPSAPAWVPQDHLEPVLLAALRERPAAEVRFGSELTGLRRRGDRVRATLRDHTGGGLERAVEASYVVGADGAHSTVRETLGIRMDGPAVRGDYSGVQFRAPLWRHLDDRRYGLNIITVEGAAGVLAPRGPGDRWHYGRERGPGQERLTDLPHERLAALIGTAAGVPDLRPRIEYVSAFGFATRIARRYRRGPGFLVGDAAHQMTPRGGTGMNTAIQDAYDLGWKLAWVLRGWADPALLDTYEDERRPVALHNVTRSADANGAQRQADEALRWDLNGRLRHRWLEPGGRRVSTLDLLGPGVTLLAGPDGAGRPAPGCRAPLTRHTVDEPTAHALAVPPGGALVLRPDGREMAPGGSAL